jgi:hypothetical protein
MSLRRSARLAALGTGVPVAPVAPVKPQPQLRRSERLIMPAYKWFSHSNICKVLDMAAEVKGQLNRMETTMGKPARAAICINLYNTLLGPGRLLLLTIPLFRDVALRKTYEFEAETQVMNNPNPLPEDTRRRLASIIKRTRHYITDVAPLDSRYLTKEHLPLGWTARKDYTGRIVYRNTYRMTEVYEHPTRTGLSF